MGVSRREVERLGRLAKLSVSKDKIIVLSGQVKEVVDYFKLLAEVDTKDTEAMAQSTGLLNNLRADEASSASTLQVEKALSWSDSTHNGYFKVPALIDKNENSS